jgi:hypothetical protein
VKKSETNKILAIIFAVFPRAEVDDDSVLEAYHLLLGHLAFDLALLAVQRCLSISHFEPKPADILTAAIELSATDLPDPDTAWGQAMAVSWSEPGAFSRLAPMVQAAVCSIGTLRDVQTSPVPWETRKQFIAAYRDIRGSTLASRCLSAHWHNNVSRIQQSERAKLPGGSDEKAQT